MAIPDYQTIMLPLLRHLANQQERSNQETHDALAAYFGLTEEERKALLSSGQQTVFANRVGWAKVYLKKAGLIESSRRGFHKITRRGVEVLKGDPQTINTQFLMQFPEFEQFIRPNKADYVTQKDFSEEKTPREHLEYGYQSIRRELSVETLKRVKACSADFFERLVVDLLVKMGYGGSHQDAGESVGKSGDGGIDGIIKEDKLGLDAIFIQAKRWEASIGRPEVQKFAGALQGQRAKKGIFITTSDFTKEAQDYVRNIDNKIVLIGGDQLATFMIDHDVGVMKEASYEIKKIDLDYFAGE